ncbi:MAG: saccharopine dehydrogenase NADP-binding domain-containing protein [Robiginitomaculum sp.]|nr:saccharopine dehydrogenase NADP-binding domain-containing protein [Robiginitomaculum sp.]
MTRFLVLGAGLVAQPLVEYLARRKSNEITLASHILSEAEHISKDYENVTPVHSDVMNDTQLNTLISAADIVISFVPPPLHPRVAKACIDAKVHMVNASYQSPELSALDTRAKAANICILSEIGLDPGIDHLSAMQIIDNAHAKNEQIESFISWCGGLPAPENNDNPLGYKFSWNPKGAILVLLNTATYLCESKTTTIDGHDLMNWAKPIEISNLNLECYPNRNSLTYQDVYGIGEAKNILRGTLRYQGFCQILQRAKTLGLMDITKGAIPKIMKWKDYIAHLNPMLTLNTKTNQAWHGLEWLGCFSDQMIVPYAAPIDVFCELLLEKLPYLTGEQDMVILLHKFVIKKPDGEKYFISSLLKETGAKSGYSAMARTVGYPAAIAAQMIADGRILRTGMIRPVTKDIYEPMLAALRKEGIIFTETITNAEETSEQNFISEIL